MMTPTASSASSVSSSSSSSTSPASSSLFPELLRQRYPDRDVLLPPATIATPTGKWSHKELWTREDEDTVAAQRAKPEHHASFLYEEQDGVTITPFDKLDERRRALVHERLLTLLPRDRQTAAHLAALTGGLLITVTANVEKPLRIRHRFSRGTDANRSTIVLLGPGTEVSLLESFDGSPRRASHTFEAFVAEGATLRYCQLQTMNGILVSRKAAVLGRDATVEWLEANAAATTYSRTTTFLEGEGSSTTALGLFLGQPGARLDLGAEARHLAPRTTSVLAARGALAGDASAIYHGVLRIGPSAEKSDAFQEAGTLLLSEEAESKASPELLIENNDVRCSHAATAARLDEEKLFYLRSRGLSEDEARRLLIAAFVWPLLGRLSGRANEFITDVLPLVERYAADALGGRRTPMKKNNKNEA